MSSAASFHSLRDEDVIRALTQLLVPRLQAFLTARSAGHCMRIADLDLALMLNIASTLRAETSQTQIHVLGNGDASHNDLFITSTKLVELRNPLPDGTQRPPLLVFLPANLHTNAEDSFNIASFEEISVANVYQDLVRTLLEKIPVVFQGYLKELLSYLTKEKWSWGDPVWQARFLLTAMENGVDEESLGAALYEVGLVPDFQLFAEPSLITNRIRKNLEAVRSLTTGEQTIRGRVFALELTDKTVQHHLTEFLIEMGVDDPRRWTRRIVLERQHWDISFDKWKFKEQTAPEKAFVEVLHTDLHTVQENASDEKLQNLVGQQVLVPKNRRSFKVEFATEPHPQQISGLGYFTVQIVSQDGATVGPAKKVKPWRSKANTKVVAIDKVNNYDFEEGWHFVRVLPWTEDGDAIPLLEKSESLLDQRARPFESELFYVLPEGTMEEDPPQRAVPHAASLEHARLRLQFAALMQGRNPHDVRVKDVMWTDKTSKGTNITQPFLEIKFGREGAFKIPVAAALQTLETKILQTPERLQSWHLRIGQEKAGALTGEPFELPRSAAVESFLAAREHYCRMILLGDRELITQAVDFSTLIEACAEYAEAYRDLLADLSTKIERAGGADQQRLVSALRAALSVDAAHVSVTDFRGRTREAAIISPTHPLRALWFNLWARVGYNWLERTKESAEYAGAVRDSILEKLAPINFPATLPMSDGRVFLAVDQIHPFWSLFAPASEDDARGLLGEVCAALGLSEPAIGGVAVTGEVLASRLERYLAQHPYVGTLIVNAFNPGRASVLAEALLWLQRKEATANLRYDIRLFVTDTESPSIGESLDQLLSPMSNIGAEADAFSVPSGNHLFPKLDLAIHPVIDFKRQPESYPAHITILFDMFPAEELSVGVPLNSRGTSPLHGLIQDFNRSFSDDENGTVWRNQPQHGVAMPLAETESLVDAISNLSADFSAATATAALGLPAFDRLPVVTVTLDAEQRALLHNLHEVSDWVFTIDRHFGIEFFDHSGKRGRPLYLVDYIPSAASGSAHQLIISSRSTSELRTSLRQSLIEYGIEANDEHATIIINALRSLSGRLALKFMSGRTHQAEALGLALARLFLEQQGALSNQIVLPLDSHLELFRSVKMQSNEIGENWGLQRTDLALFDLNASTRNIRCNLVEVKFYRQVGGVGEYQRLKEAIAEQIRQSEEVLRRHFDSDWKTPDRPDRLLKTREFQNLITFYLERAQRYELLEQDAAEEAKVFLASLEDGYTVDFSRSAIIFTLNESGSDLPEREYDIDYFRVGANVITALLNVNESVKPQNESSVAAARRAIPKITTASFIVPERERSVTRDALDKQDKVALSKTHKKKSSTINGEPENRNAALYSSPSPPDVKERSEAQGNKSTELAHTTLPVTADVSQSREIAAELSGYPEFGVMLGAQGPTPQYGIIGEVAGRKVALDLNQTHTISLFGVQGGGKSYTLGSIVEMTCVPIKGINVLPSPLATVIFHYSPTQDYKPEFTSMVHPNTDAEQLAALRERYGAEPQAIEDVVLLTPANKIAERQSEYPGIKVLPISFAASELKAAHWKFLMGAVGGQSMYLRQVNLIMRKLRESLTLKGIVQAVEDSQLSEHLKDLARTRLQFAAEYVDDARSRLSDLILPGRLMIVDLRDEFIDKDEALGLFIVLLQIFSEATIQGQSFNKLVVFDEAHKYIESSDLVAGLVEVVREMRHRGTSVLIASQDPPSVPVTLIELSSQIILHKFNSPAWLKHMQKANAALGDLSADKMNRLSAGEAYIWSSKSTDDSFTRGAIKIKCRPRVTEHGGDTRTAIT